MRPGPMPQCDDGIRWLPACGGTLYQHQHLAAWNGLVLPTSLDQPQGSSGLRALLAVTTSHAYPPAYPSPQLAHATS